MDLLDKINALTDDQLRIVAERDDASGVLASYRLAELRGLPCPDRSTVVWADDYVIVARDGEITRLALEGVTKIIREENGQFCVYSEDGSRGFGCYPSMEQAQERLRQIHYFDQEKETIREGTFVSWDSSGGIARGRVEHVMTEGVLGVPDSDFSINASPEEPAALIRVWREGPDGWAETETLVGHKVSTLNRIEPLARDTVKETFTPPQGVQEAAQRALRWIAEGHAGSGFTDVGRARAAQLARGDGVSRETIGRMASYFARHEVDSQAVGWNLGEDGFPSAGRVAWDAWGGDPGRSWAETIMDREDTKQVGKDRTFVRKADEKRFTLGPLYVPDFMDAHGEWTDAEELQNGVWHWVRSGDRRIFLQHDREVEAGEWVEVMTMPQAWTVTMRDAAGNEVGEVTYPPNTVFLGVVWNEDAWELVKRGELRGYSIGGYSDRMYAELPEGGDRDGVEMEKAGTLDIAGSIADAVAAALAKVQPTVNVVLPETRQVARRIERDEHGNISRVIEEEI